MKSDIPSGSAGGGPGPAAGPRAFGPYAADDLDRKIVHALQIDGRVPFSRLAAVLGVSDQTVARRYTRLRSAGLIKVLGLTEPESLGEVVWMVRVQCTPDSAVSVAEALARRPDTSWVSLLSGGTEIGAVTRAATSRDTDTLLLRQLPRTPRVVALTAHCVLHEFYGGALGHVNKSGALTEEEAERLRPARPEPEVAPAGPRAGPTAGPTVRPAAGPAVRPGPGPLGDADHRMLAVLARDGRAGLAELAAASGWSQSTVRRRLADLRADGTLYYDVDYDLRIFGLGASAMLWLSAPPSELAATGEALAGHPEVAFACATTGPHNLLACVCCRDSPALYRYVTTRIAALPAVGRMEMSPVIRRVKGPGPLLGPPWTTHRITSIG
ncbi:Lrp/AsnC family transcriptional regulator [Streptomyces sp. B1866]|uniref:Lrp/AsnC family transcriptional regulator n=1 Tax=Streptomyces sp. B1866 TaxID=3075431 RepID=UPI00288F8C82|nr:Lrp/AsnC family transcriptional regulator [Streptomyces sp. B1866]MDT3398840.1 Lrp/AsnC family transcriptional regulator [Streptomyces sp. B1866]